MEDPVLVWTVEHLQHRKTSLLDLNNFKFNYNVLFFIIILLDKISNIFHYLQHILKPQEKHLAEKWIY